VPIEALEDPEAAAHRAAPRHRSWQTERRAEPALDQEVRHAAVRRRVAATATTPWTREASAVLKLPPPGALPDSASDDH
jgi:hypothetical protein